jgi:two-component system, LytTR family, sensor histidine kinase AgrC
MDKYSLLNDVLFGSSEGFLFFLGYLYLVGKLDFIKKCPWKTTYIVVAYMVFAIWEKTIGNLPAHTLFYLLFMISLFSYITKTNIYSATIAMLVVLVFFGIVEIVSFMSFVAVLKLPVGNIQNDPQLRMSALLIMTPVKAILLWVVTRFKFRNILLKYKFFNKENHTVAYMLYFAVSSLIIFVSAGEIVDSSLQTIILGILFLSILVFGVIDSRDRLAKMDVENKYNLQKEYSKSMEFVVDAVRKEKHDYANHLNTLIAMCLLKSPDTLEKVEFYARKLLNNSSEHSSYIFYNTGNKYLDGFLAVKTNQANERGIYFEVDIEDTLEDINLDDVDLTNVISNIIENAFYAVAQNGEEKKKNVSLCVYIENDKYIICISNNGEMIPKENLKRIFENKFSTKAKVSGERGFGLFITSEIIYKNGGSITVSSTEEETEFIIKLNVLPGF